MLRAFQFVIAAALAAGSVNAGAQDAAPTAKETAKKVQAFYKTTKDYQADFTQTYNDLAAGTAKASKGKVYFKKPGRMRWDYKKASDPKKMEKLYVSDGSKFWVYEYDFKQVFKQCLKESQLPTSLSFLMGQGDLLKEFKVTFASNSTDSAPKLRLVPKTKTSKYKQIIFTVNPKTYQVEKTELFDPYGNSNLIEFKNAKVNKNLPDRGFDFVPPKDARVLNPLKQCP